MMPITPPRGKYHRQTDGTGWKLRLMATVTEQTRHRMTEHWRYIYSLDCFAKRLSELLKEAEDNGLSESEIAPVPSFQSFAESDSRIVLCEPPGFNKALTVGDQLLEQALRVNFVTMTCADQIHRNI